MYRRHSTVIIGLAMIISVLLGCSNGVDIEARNKAIFTRATDAMNNHEWDKLDRFFAEDFRRYSQATPDIEINSLADMVGFVKEWYTAFPDAKMETKMIVAEGNLVAVWGTFAGTHEAPIGEYPATGKRMESETFAFFRLEEGKIVESWVTWDNLAVLNQLGLFPPTTADQP